MNKAKNEMCLCLRLLLCCVGLPLSPEEHQRVGGLLPDEGKVRLAGLSAGNGRARRE